MTLAAFAPFGAGCGSSDGGGGSPQGQPPLDVLDGGSDGGQVVDDASPAVDATPPAPTFVSNTPGATVKDVGSPATPGVVLISSNLVQKPSGNEYFVEWYGEIKNTGSDTICLVSVDVSFKNAGGVEIKKFSDYVSGDAYSDTSSLTMPCTAPGGIGSIYSNDFVPSALDIGSIKTIAVAFGPHDFSGSPAPHAPTITSQPTMVFGSSYGIKGSMTGRVSAIHNIGVDFYPRDAQGLVLARFPATDLDALMPGASYPFETSGIETPFSQYRYYVSFIEGESSQDHIGGTRIHLSPSPAAALEADRRKLDSEVRAREAEARARGSR